MAPQALDEGLSEFERFITGSLPEEQLTNIRRFGMEFFSNPPSTYAPSGTVPVRPDYVIGPGDQIRIDVWGMVEGRWTVNVARDGTISIPRVGVIRVAGLTYDQLEGAIDGELSRYYSNYELSVTLGALKDIKIYVVGNARQPGAYTVSSLSTLVNALVAAGGPGPQGTMRDIQVRRGDRVVTRFDMYDFLLRGDKTKDIRLLPEDVIFIPPVGPQAAVTGNVKKPAIYELKGRTSLQQLLEMAGGMTATGYTGRVQVMRVMEREYRTIFEGDLGTLQPDSMLNLKLVDGDYIRLFSVIERMATARITGPVAKPGEFAIQPGDTRLADVLHRSGGLLYYASPEAEITRVMATPEGPMTERIRVNLKKAMAGDPAHNLLLQMNDYIFVRAVPNWKLYRQVQLKGEVRYPGIYTIEDGEKLSSVLERAGGFTDKAYPRGAILTRESVREAQEEQIREMVNRLERELAAVGANELSAALTSEEAQILQAEAEQKRQLLQKLKETRATGRVTTLIAPPEVIKGTAYDIALEHGDRIYIPANPSTVQVLGSVLNPAAFVYDKALTWRDFIRMAGGYTKDANPDRIYILKADGTAVRVKRSLQSAAPWVKEFGDEADWSLVEPGDAVIVPQKVASYTSIRQTRDYLDIVYKMAVTMLSIDRIGD
jgi:protein involved in polysaccharide export with SLBB domain